MKVPQEITRLLDGGSSFLLTSHESPDSDALGSMLALASLLESLGKKVSLYCSDNVPAFLRFLPGSEKISSDLGGDFDALVVLDCPVPSRAGSRFGEYAASCGTEIAIIDHHKEQSSPGAVKWVETSAPATGIMVYEIFKAFDAQIPPAAATCIYAAISGDTGSFRFSNATPECFRVAAEMVSLGADPEKISSAIYENQSLERMELLARVLATLKTDKTGKVGWVRIDKEMFESTRTTREDSEGMVDLPMSVKGVCVALLFRQERDGDNLFWKASIRSRGDIDVSEVASMFGGGGHKNAAGFTFKCGTDEALEKILEAVGGG